MNNVRSSHPLTVNVPSFNLPTSQKEFDALTYSQKAVLYEEYPGTYFKFTKKDKKPWER